MGDGAENLAGAGTDVWRCPDALGPRKNLHGRTPHGRVPYCVYLMGVYLTGVHLNGRVPHGVSLTGVHLMGVYHGRAPHGLVSHAGRFCCEQAGFRLSGGVVVARWRFAGRN
jgi:hypothetical protein